MTIICKNDVFCFLRSSGNKDLKVKLFCAVEVLNWWCIWGEKLMFNMLESYIAFLIVVNVATDKAVASG